MKRMLIYALGFVLVSVSAGFSMHHGGGMKDHGRQHGGKWWQDPSVAEMISLSAEEQGKVSDLWVQHRRKMIKLKGNLHVETFELEVLDDNVDVDVTALRERFEKVQQARADIAAERFNHRMEIRSLLGAERFSKIRSYFPMQRKEKRKGGQGIQNMGCGKAMMGMDSCSKGQMYGRSDKSGCKRMETPQGPVDE